MPLSRLLPLLVLIPLLLPAGPAGASDSPPFVIATAESPPFLYLLQDGTPAGPFVRTVEQASTLSGVAIRLDVSNWARAIADATRGNVDSVAGVGYMEERKDDLVFPGVPLTTLRYRIYIRAGRELVFADDLSHLAGLRLGYIRGSKAPPAIQKMADAQKLFLEPRHSLELMVRAVERGRLDGIGLPERVAEWFISQQKERPGIEPNGPVIFLVDVFLALSRKSERREDWEKLLEAFKSLREGLDGETSATDEPS